MRENEWASRRPGADITSVTRRRFLGAAGAVAAGGAAFGLVGCGDDDDDSNEAPTSAETGTSTSAETSTSESTPENGGDEPKSGGTLRAGKVSNVILNGGYPYIDSAENTFLEWLIPETLIRYRDSLEPELVLAERFELNDTMDGVLIELKPDLTFHDGAPVTVEDVFFGIELTQDPASKGVTGTAQLGPFAKRIVSMDKVDERTMQFTFDSPTALIPDFFAQLSVSRQETYPELMEGTNVQGTGPFKFREWNPGQGISFEKNPDWHGSSTSGGGPFLDEIQVSFFADADALGLAYESGEIDLINSAQASQARRFSDLVYQAPKTGLTYVGCNVTHPLLQDPRVRQAVFLAIDRERIMEELNEGFGELTVQPWPKTSPAFDPELEGAHYDPDRARALLEEAGFSQTEPIPFEHRSLQAYVNLVSLIQQNFSDIGVEVELIPREPTDFTARLQAREFAGFWATAHSFSQLSPANLLQVAFPYRIPNLSYFDPPEYQAILDAVAVADPLSDEAVEQYDAFNELWMNEPWLLPASAGTRVDMVSERVRGYGTYFVTPQQAPDLSVVWLA